MPAQSLDSAVDRLIAADDAYYSGQHPIMSDSEYDGLRAFVENLAPTHPVLRRVGAAPNNGWPKVKHASIRGSLDKAQSLEDVADWMKDKQGPYLVTEKLDGIYLELVYVDGGLDQALTRGDGITGENIVRNASIMQGVRADLDPSEGLVQKDLAAGITRIKGEVITKKSDFIKHFPGQSNPRNTASGTAKGQTDWMKCQHLTFIAHSIERQNKRGGAITHYKDFQNEELDALTSMGFITPFQEEVATLKQAQAVYEDYILIQRANLNYMIDGLVIGVNEYALKDALGYSSNGQNPKGAIALKFPHETAKTKMLGVDWSVKMTGRVTPIAFFQEVLLGGARVTNASLHNPSYLAARAAVTDGNFGVGSEILVSKRNDIIPQVEMVICNPHGTAMPAFPVPTECPSCGHTLGMNGKYLQCPNTMQCPAQLKGVVLNWLQKTGTLHFGTGLVDTLFNEGMLTSIADLYRLDLDAVMALKQNGRKVGGRGRRALESLHANKKLTPDVFVGSLGIPLCGRSVCKWIVGAGYDTLAKMASVSEEELAAIPHFGEGRAREFRKGFDERKALLMDLHVLGVEVVEAAPEPEVEADGILTGKAVCLSGTRDKTIQEEILKAGGRIASGVSKKTDFLVLKDKNSTSSKAKKARELGIPVMDVGEMRNYLS